MYFCDLSGKGAKFSWELPIFKLNFVTLGQICMWQRLARYCSANFLFLGNQKKKKKIPFWVSVSDKLQSCEWVLAKEMWVKMMSTISRHACVPFVIPLISCFSVLCPGFIFCYLRKEWSGKSSLSIYHQSTVKWVYSSCKLLILGSFIVWNVILLQLSGITILFSTKRSP